LLAEQLEVKEMVNRALRSVTVVEVKAEERVPQQVVQLEEVIQQLQQCIADLELCTVPETPQDVRDQREATARNAVDRLKSLALECKQLSNRSAQTYENLTENPELQTLESQLQEVKQACRYTTGAAEGPVGCRKNEEVSRTMHNSTTDPYASKKSDGSHSTTSTCAR
jgi:septation ring formation regulator EzrA